MSLRTDIVLSRKRTSTTEKGIYNNREDTGIQTWQFESKTKETGRQILDN